MPRTSAKRRSVVLLSSFVALVAAVLMISHAVQASVAVHCQPAAVAGDQIRRGFYVPEYLGRGLSRVDLWVSANSAGIYALSLTARRDTYDGVLIGTSEVIVTLSGSLGDYQPVSFRFPGGTSGYTYPLTFKLEKISGPGEVYYRVHETFSGGCPTVVETADTTPPLSTFRRNGVDVTIYSTEPSSLINCASTALGGDLISRGFYILSYPGYSLSRVDLTLQASAAGWYVFTLTARAEAFDGPLIGRSRRTVYMGAGAWNLVEFYFPWKTAAPFGGTVAFTIEKAAEPEGAILFEVITSGAGGDCSQVIETNDNSPPLSTYRRTGVEVAIQGLASTTGVNYEGTGNSRMSGYHLPTNQFLTFFSGNWGQYGWGASDSMPLIWDPFGYDKTEISVYHIPTNQWFVKGFPGDNLGQFGWGMDESVPVPGDYNGDGTMERAFYHWPTNRWFVEWPDRSVTYVDFGWDGADCIPLPGDYDGDGRTDMVLYHIPSNQWFMYGVGNLGQYGWNGEECLPVPGDYDGSGHTDIAVYHVPTNQWFVRGYPGDNMGQYGWGGADSFPVIADWNGDRALDRGFYRPDLNWWFLEGVADDYVWGWGAFDFMPITSQATVYNWFRFVLGRFQ